MTPEQVTVSAAISPEVYRWLMEQSLYSNLSFSDVIARQLEYDMTRERVAFDQFMEEGRENARRN